MTMMIEIAAPARREALIEERTALLARLAEINAELADIPTIEELIREGDELDEMLADY